MTNPIRKIISCGEIDIYIWNYEGIQISWLKVGESHSNNFRDLQHIKDLNLITQELIKYFERNSNERTNNK